MRLWSPTFFRMPRLGLARAITGFTLVELLVVITLIGILASLLLTAIAKSHSKAAQTVCVSNERQVALAFLLYLNDNDDIFPTGAAGSEKGAHPEDWIWWQVERDSTGASVMRKANGSALAPFLSGYNSRYFRCPADKDAAVREAAWKANPMNEQYVYSYSLNAVSQRGMASYISSDRSMIFLNKHAQIARPSEKIMLAEEKGSPNDGPGTAVIDDGRWLPPGYPLTSRHSSKANVAFADGHVATVDRAFADSEHPERFIPEL